jgi:hypothetical protein
MNRGECAADVLRHAERFPRREWTVGREDVLQRASFDQLHPQADASVDPVRAEDRDHRGVPHLREQPRLAEILGVRLARREQLQRDGPGEPTIPRAVDDA